MKLIFFKDDLHLDMMSSQHNEGVELISSRDEISKKKIKREPFFNFFQISFKSHYFGKCLTKMARKEELSGRET